MIVYAVVDAVFSPNVPLGVELEVFFRREDAERFIGEGVCGTRDGKGVVIARR